MMGFLRSVVWLLRLHWVRSLRVVQYQKALVSARTSLTHVSRLSLLFLCLQSRLFVGVF